MTLTPLFFERQPFILLNRNPRAHRVLDDIDGFEQFRTSYQRAAASHDIPDGLNPFDAAQRVLDGEDLAEVTTEFVRLNRVHRETLDAVRGIRTAAQDMHDANLHTFIRTNQAAIRRGILAGYNETKAAAKAILPGFVPIRTRDDAIADPTGAAIYGQMEQLGRDLLKWRDTYVLLAEFDPRERRDLPYVDILKTYGKAWKNFHRYEVDTLNLEHQRRSISTMHEHAPWPTPTDLIVDIARRDLPLWVPSREEYEQRYSQLQQQAHEGRRTELAEMRP